MLRRLCRGQAPFEQLERLLHSDKRFLVRCDDLGNCVGGSLHLGNPERIPAGHVSKTRHKYSKEGKSEASG